MTAADAITVSPTLTGCRGFGFAIVSGQALVPRLRTLAAPRSPTAAHLWRARAIVQLLHLLELLRRQHLAQGELAVDVGLEAAGAQIGDLLHLDGNRLVIHGLGGEQLLEIDPGELQVGPTTNLGLPPVRR